MPGYSTGSLMVVVYCDVEDCVFRRQTEIDRKEDHICESFEVWTHAHRDLPCPKYKPGMKSKW